MTTPSRRMSIGVFTLPTGNSIMGWRLPGAIQRSEDFPAILNVARIAEAGKLDFVFFADTPACVLGGHPGHLLRFEPTTLLAALATHTTPVGLVATVSTSYQEPYNLARLVATADYLSGGRAGWNVVTTSNPDAAPNFGREAVPHDQRYEIAAEYLEVVQGLWDSWEADAVQPNPETGDYYDRSKVHVLDHKGKYFQVRGPLNHSRSPQGQPVIVQAGSSPAGQGFAARFAEVVFTVQQDLGESKAFADGLRQQVAAAGRSPDHVRVLPGFYPVVGRTEEEAKAKFAELARYVIPGSATNLMSERYGHDLSVYPMDGPVPDLPLSQTRGQSFAKVLFAKARRENWTLKDLHDLIALSRAYLMVVGTPATIADVMEEWFTAGACDGFMLTPAYFPTTLEDFTELVVPELQKRGLFRTDYEAKTLRGHMGLPEPKNRFAK